MDENRELDGRLRANGLQEYVGGNASVPTAQFQGIGAALPIISFRRWDFSAMDVSRAYSKPAPLQGAIYVIPPYAAARKKSKCGNFRNLYTG